VPEMSPLRRRMIEDMTVQSVAGDATILRPCSLEVQPIFWPLAGSAGSREVRAFQVHPVATGISWPALNQTVCARRFFYGVTLGHGEILEPFRMPGSRASCRSC
jgi:integrase/recombinase XerD